MEVKILLIKKKERKRKGRMPSILHLYNAFNILHLLIGFFTCESLLLFFFPKSYKGEKGNLRSYSAEIFTTIVVEVTDMLPLATTAIALSWWRYFGRAKHGDWNLHGHAILDSNSLSMQHYWVKHLYLTLFNSICTSISVIYSSPLYAFLP